MSWFKGEGSRATAVARANHEIRHKHHAPHVSEEIETRLVEFLISHDRLRQGNGRPLMHLLGVSHNAFDGTTDYAVRTRVHDLLGKDRRFDSTIRIYPSGHLRLLR